MPSSPKFKASVGIDLVSLERMKKFASRHRAGVRNHLLTDRELKKARKRKLTPLYLSKLFAAKEAVFKAAKASWMGPAGFRDIEVELLEGNRFRARSARYLPASGSHCSGKFFRKGSYLGAEVIIWQSV